MGTDGIKVMDVAEVVAWERQLAESGTSLLELMTRAGHAVARFALELMPNLGHAVILCGSGNNGGDGWVAASQLVRDGIRTTLVTKAPACDITAEPARTAARMASEQGGFDVLVNPDEAQLAQAIGDADLTIDAILGTGFAHDAVRAPYDVWIRLANEARETRGVPVLAVDCPSGMNAQTGQCACDCIEADVTVTMFAVKRGMTHPDAARHVGTIELAPLV